VAEDHLAVWPEFVQARTEMLRTGAFRDPGGSLTVARHFRRILGSLMQGAYAGPRCLRG
jgi:hypothetical protein